jgi:PIN domain nuclease of toxin-antitoxin system
MKLLLDTHVWLWSMMQPERLSRGVRRELEKPANELYLSPISIWEMRQLERRGRFRSNQVLSQSVENVIAQSGIREAPFSFAVAVAASRIELPQHDLGDVFLAATASTFGLTLVTADAQLLACGWLKTLAAD